MSKVNISNELIKRDFFKWLKEAKGNCDSSVNNIEKAILKYESFTNYALFSTYDREVAIEFKKWLKNNKYKGKTIAISTYHTYMRYLRTFFTWLAGQPIYRNKISLDSVEYLNVQDKEEKMARQQIPRKYPDLDYILKLTDSINVSNEIDLRDKALISFTALSGMRDKAIITLPLSNFDTENFVIYQNPKKGVQTKFSKYIYSILFKFDEKLVENVTKWIDHLKSKNYNESNPLFPRSKTKQDSKNPSFDSSTEIEPKYWSHAGAMRKIFKDRCLIADLEYYPPHTYRHFTIDIALKHCKNGEQIKAVSQNFGHENVGTTLGSYANFEPNRLSEVLNSINFSQNTENTDSELIEQILNLIKNWEK